MDHYLEVLRQTHVGKTIVAVDLKEYGQDSYYRFTFDDGGYSEWYVSLYRESK